MKKILIFIAFGIIVVGYFALSSNICKTTRLNIYNGQGLTSIQQTIENNPNIKTKTPLILALFIGNEISSIKAGSYELNAGMNNLEILKKLLSGSQTPIQLTFNNLRTKEQLSAKLGNELMIDSLTIINALNNKEIQQKYNLTDETIICLFLPDTYEVYWTISAEDLIEKMHKEYLRFWNETRIKKGKNIGKSKNEIITLASIVEEESNWNSELSTIAGLYINRLRIGMPLQADPTIKFAVGDFSLKRITKRWIDLSAESPYNTYTHVGLPPGPIRIPSKKTIDAVLNYEKHQYIYMCAKPNREPGHNFATNFNNHQNNARAYQRYLNKIGVKK